MKKKFIISGVAVFLVVLLCSSALFAFADSFAFSLMTLDDDNVVVSLTSSDISSDIVTTSTKGGSLTYYWKYYAGPDYFVIPSYFDIFYSRSATLPLHYLDSKPVVGSTVLLSSDNAITLTGVPLADTFSGGGIIYRYSFPADHPYYITTSFYTYTPPLFVRVNSFISGFFSAAGDFLDGVMSVPILAILVIGVPVTGLITAVTLGLTVGRKKNKSYKKSRRRR